MQDSFSVKIRTEGIVGLVALTLQLAGCIEESGNSSTYSGNAHRLTTHTYVRSIPIDSRDYKSGVRKHIKGLAYPGVHIYPDFDSRQALLIDMDGRVLHTLVDSRKVQSGGWDVVKHYRNGEFLVLSDEHSIFRIDWDSNVLWEVKLPLHHDFGIASNGDIYAVFAELCSYPDLLREPALYDVLVIIAPDGTIKREIRLAKILANYPKLVAGMRASTEAKQVLDDQGRRTWIRDPMHTNTIHVIRQDVRAGDRHKRFEQGQVMFCMPSINTIFVLEVDQQNVVWQWGQEHLEFPHSPVVLDNGRVAVFDNGRSRGYSRVVEVDSVTNQITQVISGDHLRNLVCD